MKKMKENPGNHLKYISNNKLLSEKHQNPVENNIKMSGTTKEKAKRLKRAFYIRENKWLLKWPTNGLNGAIFH